MSSRRMTSEDLAAIIRLHKYAKCKGKPAFEYSQEMEYALRATADAAYGAVGWVIVTPGEEVVAALTAQLEPGATDELVLLTIVVRADARRKQYGHMLLQHLVEYAHQAGISRIVADVANDNVTAWKFFSRCGFQRSTSDSDFSFEVSLDLAAMNDSGLPAQMPAQAEHLPTALPRPVQRAASLASAGQGMAWRPYISCQTRGSLTIRNIRALHTKLHPLPVWSGAAARRWLRV